MTLIPEDIRQKMFSTTRLKEGYVADEVDEFLDAVAAAYEACQRRGVQLDTELRSLRDAPTTQVPVYTYEQDLQPAPPQEEQLSGEAIKSILVAAQSAADRMEADAAAQVAIIQAEAQRKADILMSDAKVEAEQIIGAATVGADARIAKLRTEQTALENKLKSLQTKEVEYRKFLKAALDAFDNGLKEEF